jgi:hypothetical protein
MKLLLSYYAVLLLIVYINASEYSRLGFVILLLLCTWLVYVSVGFLVYPFVLCVAVAEAEACCC